VLTPRITTGDESSCISCPRWLGIRMALSWGDSPVASTFLAEPGCFCEDREVFARQKSGPRGGAAEGLQKSKRRLALGQGVIKERALDQHRRGAT